MFDKIKYKTFEKKKKGGVGKAISKHIVLSPETKCVFFFEKY